MTTAWYVEILFEGIWTSLGRGHSSKEDAEWFLSSWRQNMECYKDHFFRVMEHTQTESTSERTDMSENIR